MDDNELKKLIREKTEHVEIPESLKAEAIRRKLQEQEAKNRFNKRKQILIAVSAAAGFCIIAGLTALVGRIVYKQGQHILATLNPSPDGPIGTTSSGDTADDWLSDDTTLAAAEDYDQIYKYIRASNNQNNRQQYQYAIVEDAEMVGELPAPTASSSANSSAKFERDQAAGDYSDTNVREAGVGEGDIVKTDGKNLYILENQKIRIVNIEKDQMEELETIYMDADQYVSEIFLEKDRLIVIFSQERYNDSANEYSRGFQSYTVAQVYDVSNPGKPKLLNEISQSGSFYTMRVVDGYVYVFSSFYADTRSGRKDIWSYVPEVDGDLIASDSIWMPQYRWGNQYVVVAGFSLENPREKIDSTAIFGGTGLCYVSRENIYLAENYYNNNRNSQISQTCIRKIAFYKGEFEPIAQTKVDGTLKDSFCIDEYEDNLRLVVTVNREVGARPFSSIRNWVEDTTERVPTESNSLYILDEDLNMIGSVEGLAEDEKIYSARFMGDIGYFVTFRQIDPLFSVDLSNPKRPKILGELKIPGFSEYLHPYMGGLLGIGVDVDEHGMSSNGVKLSMFDTSDPRDVEEIDKYVLEGIYYTNVSYNYKAVMISENRNLIGFSAQGAISHYFIFSYDERNGFTPLFDRELSGYNEARGVYSGETFYLINGNTIESYRLDSFEKIDDIVL